MTLRRLLAPALAITVLALGGSGTAAAYYTAGGTGTATAAVGTVDAPTAVTADATPGQRTVHVSGPAPAGGIAPQRFRVVRRASDGTTAVACETPSTSCDDPGRADDTYSYTVVAVLGSWTATSAAAAPVTVIGDITPPSVVVGRADGQANATHVLPIRFAVRFSEPVVDFTAADVTRGGTATTTLANVAVTGEGRDYVISFTEPPAIGDGVA